MSGGHFNDAQYRLEDIAVSIDELIASNDSTAKNQWRDEIGNHFPPDIIAKFAETALTLRIAAAMAQRVDWLVCGDDGEDSFQQRWEEEVTPLLKGAEGTP